MEHPRASIRPRTFGFADRLDGRALAVGHVAENGEDDEAGEETREAVHGRREQRVPVPCTNKSTHEQMPQENAFNRKCISSEMIFPLG